MKSLGRLLKEAREKKSLSQKDIAEKLGYSTAQFISNWERGISHPPMSTIKILSKLYGVPVESFYNAALEDELAEVRKKLHAKYFGNKKTSKKTLEDEHLKSQTDNI